MGAHFTQSPSLFQVDVGLSGSYHILMMKTLFTLRRLLLLTSISGLIFACESQGCEGCQQEPIPGGFPVSHRFENAIQVRVARHGLDFLEENFESLVATIVPTGLTFDIPPTGCTSNDQKICCDGNPCSASMDIQSVSITPISPNKTKLHVNATVQTTKIKYQTYQLFSWWTCDVQYDSTEGSPSTLGLDADVDLIIQADRKLKIQRSNTSFSNVQCGDISISGSWYCTVADWLCTFFRGTIENGVTEAINDTVDSLLEELPTGQEGRFDLASFMSDFSPTTGSKMDYILWGGGYAQAENDGVSAGTLAGFKALVQNPCVPDCEATGSICTPPPKPEIVRSPIFRGNERPDGKPFQVGLGIHQFALDMAAYAMYKSGGLCLDVGANLVSQLSSDIFGYMFSSLPKLTGGKNVPIKLSFRPMVPVDISFGAGKYHEDNNGILVIDEPLITLSARDFTIHVYVLIDNRYIRLFTVTGDLVAPAMLFADANGDLQIILGELKNALTNVRVENAELIEESPEELAAVFPTLVGIGASFAASGLEPIPLPSIQGIKMLLDEGSITSVENNQILALFANLSLAAQQSSS
ncbi:MAG: hypothetical protein V1754_11935, partial [Pseudomonadota bacterium]